MTQIIMVLNTEYHATYIDIDPRPPREVMMAINMGKTVIGTRHLQMAGRQQRAELLPYMDLVVVFVEPPLVRLTRRQYQVLFGLSERKSAAEIAAELGISRRMVYGYTGELKQRFGLQTVKEVLAQAFQYGLIDLPFPPPEKNPAQK